MTIPRGLDRDPHIQVEPGSAGAAVAADDPIPARGEDADGAGGAPAPAEPNPEPARKRQPDRLPRYGAPLSEREQRSLELIAKGLSNRQIAAEMYLSEDTIKTHNRRLFAKLGVHDRAHAVTIGFERRLLRLPDTTPPAPQPPSPPPPPPPPPLSLASATPRPVVQRPNVVAHLITCPAANRGTTCTHNCARLIKVMRRG